MLLADRDDAEALPIMHFTQMSSQKCVLHEGSGRRRPMGRRATKIACIANAFSGHLTGRWDLGMDS